MTRTFTTSRIPVLRGETARLRPIRPEELRTVAARMAADPTVSRWWSADTEKLRHWLQEPESVVFVIEDRGAPGGTCGIVQVSSHSDDPDYEYAGLDIALFDEGRGRGLGPDALRTAASWLFHAHGFHRITIDPAFENAAALRAYEKAGFKRIGVARDYERGDDGEWHDNVLFDLLPADLGPPPRTPGTAEPAGADAEAEA